ncbi:MAG: site-2 protease family protein [Anaerolineaceae bacterium]|nr:site-2 protease family protein [Anaerolineaceae bacterium]
MDLDPIHLLARAIALLIGMTIHEFAHVYVAYRMGDNTAANQGRLTLNPLVHINPIGFIMGVIIGFGFLGSAPINPYRMRNPRWGYLAAVAAGPISNLLIAIVFAIPLRLAPQLIYGSSLVGEVLFQIIFLNIILALFNIIPLYPLDGWSIMYSLLPPDQARWWQANQQNSYYLFMLLILLGFIGGQFNLLGILIGQPSTQIFRILVGF